MSRTCKGCGGLNDCGRQAQYCSTSCRWKAYSESEKGKAARKAYQQSERGKAIHKAYRQTKSSKAWEKAYGKSVVRRASHKAYRASESGKASRRRQRAALYGITVERLEELLARGCYAPGCEVTGSGWAGLHIDHDHGCCPGKKSCGRCVRGALCGFHNKCLGFIEADWQFAVWVMSQPSLVLKIRREA